MWVEVTGKKEGMGWRRREWVRHGDGERHGVEGCGGWSEVRFMVE